MKFLRTHKTDLALVFLALAVHLAVFAFVVQANSGDVQAAVRGDDGFFELANNVLAGNGFSWSAAAPYAPNPLRTPGYSYVLAALIGMFGVTGAALFQMAVASSLPSLGARIAERITNSRTTGVVTGIILALDPTLALLSFQFYTETFFLVLFFLWIRVSITYLDRANLASIFFGATLLGFAILVRTSAQYFPLLFIAFIGWRNGFAGWRRGVAHASLYLLIVGALLTPWIIRNAQEFGVLGLSAQTPFMLYTNLAPAVLSVAHKSDFAAELRSFLTEDEFRGNAITLANGDIYTERALDIVRTYPGAALFVAGKSLFTFFTNDGMYTLLVRGGHNPENYFALLVLARLIWIAITLAALVGACVYLYRDRSPRILFTVILVVYFAVTSTVAAFGTNPRYRLPVDPIIIALAVWGGARIIEYAHRLKHRLVA